MHLFTIFLLIFFLKSCGIQIMNKQKKPSIEKNLMCPNDEKFHTKKLIIFILSRFSHFFADIYHLNTFISQRQTMVNFFIFM
ncbi:hypothetical protein DC345_04390 [Paenibacillus taichungensis]|uniref:Uncharacterized protein n=1 Tax=Paenibacillus taichungensis TaxID=484184 RepID=A0A329R4C7_9BACL|nr:hypothetical protein DC345_04390 [Paenibacillus taichungensis]